MSQSAREHVRDAGGEGPLRAYEAIHQHAELELELAGRGEIELLSALGARWEELIAELPASPPPAAAPLLETAKLIHERTRVELLRLRDALLAELANARRARRAADGYAGHTRHRPRMDRSA
ncbi:MAG TPA: hypothetical protein VMF09_16995 [Solirubrobacteraceae bacterium]|nr:hypothetical protein [Solirubrobacteraceae bacterium]